MERDVEICENNFIEIVTDALMLYEAGEVCENIHAKEALARACVLSICLSIEAAANSFLKSVECDAELKRKIDRFSTLEKFDFVLQWGQGDKLEKSDCRYRDVCSLLKVRNAMAHPKIVKKSTKVKTSVDDSGVVHHTELLGDGSGSSSIAIDMEYAKNSFKVMVDFLNAFVEDWWVGGRDTAEECLFPTWSGSLKSQKIMVLEYQIELLIKHNEMLNIRFIGIYGLLPGQ